MLRRFLALAAVVLPLAGITMLTPADAWAASPSPAAQHGAAHRASAPAHPGKSHAPAKRHAKTHKAVKHRSLAKNRRSKGPARAKTAFHHRGRVHKRHPAEARAEAMP